MTFRDFSQDYLEMELNFLHKWLLNKNHCCLKLQVGCEIALFLVIYSMFLICLACDIRNALELAGIIMFCVVILTY